MGEEWRNLVHSITRSAVKSSLSGILSPSACSRSPSRNAAVQSLWAEAEFAPRYPMVGSFPDGCARATTAFSLFMSFPNRWSVLGLSIGAMLAFMASGLLIGFWVVYRWTEPAQFGESQPRQEA